MPRLRRAIGLVTGILVLQLTLLGAAAPCGDPAGDQVNPPSDHSSHAVPVPATTDGENCDEHAGDLPAPAGSGAASCIAMISCVTPMLQLAVQPSPAGNVIASAVIGFPDLEPPTRNTVPELPPPRA